MGPYRIHRFSKLTGLTPHVIRAWERRYQLVKPERGKNRYRLYNDEDVLLFRYLKREIDQGLTIGDLAAIGRTELLARAKLASLDSPNIAPPAEDFLAELLEAVQRNDYATFEKRLNGAVAVIPFEEALHRFLFPLQERIGQLWHDGKMNVAQEHYVTNQVRQKVLTAMNQLRLANHGPTVIIGCPPQEFHEIGAQAVCYLCAALGCRTHYLGANLPFDDLRQYCEQVRPSLTILSVTILPSQFEAETLARDLSDVILGSSPVAVGGMGVQPFREIFERYHIPVFHGLPEVEAHILTLIHSRGIE